jgi:hypothetical protein
MRAVVMMMRKRRKRKRRKAREGRLRNNRSRTIVRLVASVLLLLCRSRGVREEEVRQLEHLQ